MTLASALIGGLSLILVELIKARNTQRARQTPELIVPSKYVVQKVKREQKKWVRVLAFVSIGGVLGFTASVIFVKAISPMPGPTATDLPVILDKWEIEYFGNTNLDAPSVFQNQIDAVPDQEGYVLSQSSLDFSSISQFPASNRSIRYTGSFHFSGGRYAFHCKHHDGCRIFVDGYNWIDAWWDGEGQHDLARDLTTGIHVVTIEFYDKSGQGYLDVWWERNP